MPQIDPVTYRCDQNYRVEILSIVTLVIYLNDFLSDAEIRYLLALGYVMEQVVDCSKSFLGKL